MKRDWLTTTSILLQLLSELTVDDREGRRLTAEDGFRRWAELLAGIRRKRRRVYLIGNGANASMCSQFATAMDKNAHLHAELFTDPVLISGIANDLGYEWVYAEPLRHRGQKGDMLICLSSSGRSPNILKAAEFADRLGIHTVTLSGLEPDNPLRGKGDLNFYVAAGTYADVQTCHAAILQHAVEQVAVDQSATGEIPYQKIFADPAPPPSKSANPDSAFFLP